MKKSILVVITVLLVLGVFIGYEIKKANTVNDNEKKEVVNEQKNESKDTVDNKNDIEKNEDKANTQELSQNLIAVEKEVVNVYAVAKYPEFENSENLESIKELNKLTKDYAEEVNGEYANFVNTAPFEITSPYNNVTYKIEQIKGKVVSIIFTIRGNHGGASDFIFPKVINFDLEKGDTFKLEDLFKKDSNHLVKISELSRKYLLNQSYSDEQTINSGTEPISEKFLNYYFKNNSIIFVFDKYQVAPGAAGIQEAVIAISELEDLLSEYGKDLLVN